MLPPVQIINKHQLLYSIPSRRTIVYWGFVLVSLLLAIRIFFNAPAIANPSVSLLRVSWISRGNDATQFETLSPSHIDISILQNAPQNDDHCKDIMVFMPRTFGVNGQGSQINSYLLATLVATFLDKPLLILEPPRTMNFFTSGSQFGCPTDLFEDNQEGGGMGGKLLEGFPDGLNRMIRYPKWISRGCHLPSCGGMGYNDWETERRNQSPIFLFDSSDGFMCNEETGGVKVLMANGYYLIHIFTSYIRPRMIDRSSPGYNPESARHWATRLGANHYEATVFSLLTAENDIWDFLAGLFAKSDILRFQPWIARDVLKYLQESNLPIGVSYDAVHVRRGDKLSLEAKIDVHRYWTLQGYQKEEDFPTNYIPFEHYMMMGYGGGDTCREINSNGMGSSGLETRLVYIATDDPQTVWQEMKTLYRAPGQLILVNGCHHLHFLFSPAAQDNSTIYHLHGGSSNDCAERYERNIQGIADLMLLAKSDKFIGDYNSNWGRLIRNFRVVLKKNLDAWISESGNSTTEPPVFVREVVVAFGPDHPGHIGF